ncbi:MAG: glycosyltransferase family 39 protein [Moraxellaceae bacterium]|nr:glycosyltransferase family 39 protein [Moraxellaceae bacterium]
MSPPMEFIDTPRNRSIELPLWFLAVLTLAYALPGNLGHAPWRGDDALHIGIAFEMLHDGHWLVPTVAGLPWTDSPPLLHWLGAVTGALLGWLLPLADAIRLGTVLAVLGSLWLLRETARLLFDETAGTAALLLGIGSIGLVVHAHEAQPMMLLMAMQVANLYGLALMPRDAKRGGLIAGAAAGAAFLTNGLHGLLLTLPLWALLVLGCRECRQGSQRGGLLTGLGVALLLSVLWPLALAVWAPEHLSAWWRQELAESLPHAGHLARLRATGEQIGWFTWPLWPVALYALWRRRQVLSNYPHALLLSGLLLSLLVVITTGTLRPANAMPLLPAFILLAASEVTRLRRGAANLFDWFGIMTFCALGIFVWLAWSASQFGWPAPLARNVLRLAPDYAPTWSWLLLVLALCLSVAWIVALVRMPYFPLRGALHWALGVTLLWGLAATLWLPWIDHTKSYETIANQMARHVLQYVPPGTCIASRGAGDSQRAAFYFHEQLRLDPSATAAASCPLMITFATGRSDEPAAGADWLVVWTHQRGRGRQADSITLWRRAPVIAVAAATP